MIGSPLLNRDRHTYWKNLARALASLESLETLKARALITNYQETTFRAAAVLSEKTEKTRDLIVAYMRLTKEVLPLLASGDKRNWPVREDHCFQRIVLDTICGGVWHEHLDRPAYKHLTNGQAQLAVELCQAIAEGRADLKQLNQQSLIWRGKWRNPS